jgi:hypothetical protein
MARSFDGSKCDDWRRRLTRFDSSGLTVVEFCRREHVSQASFYYWSKRIRDRGDAKTRKLNSPDACLATSPRQPENDSVEVLVGDSIRVRMHAGEPAAVAALIRLLQEAAQTIGTTTASRFQRIELTR